MTVFRIVALVLWFLTSLWFAACSGSAVKNENGSPNSRSANTSESNSANTNIEELGMLLKVPYEAEDIAWKEFSSPRRLVAVIRFTPSDSVRIVDEAEKLRPPEPITIQSEVWFPGELIAQGNLSGDDTLKGTSYAVNAFLMEPFTSGKISRIEGTDYFVLEVSAK